jgi:hypothetical protein
VITETLTDEGLGVLAAVQWRDEASPWSFWAQGMDAEGGANRAQIVNGGLTGFYSSFDMKLGLGLYWMTSTSTFVVESGKDTQSRYSKWMKKRG